MHAHSQNEPFPSQIHFRYTLPLRFTTSITGERSRLPPSFQESLTGIPGFKVDVSYGICVHIARSRDGSDWWRKEKRLVIIICAYYCTSLMCYTSRLQVPFRYIELTRPGRPGPFPPLSTRSEHIPKTLFKFSVRSRSPDHNNIDVHVRNYISHHAEATSYLSS